jgi:hypothetical protein
MSKKPVQTVTIDALLDVCAFGDREARPKARRELIEALERDGYRHGTAKQMAQGLIAERRHTGPRYLAGRCSLSHREGPRENKPDSISPNRHEPIKMWIDELADK